MRPLVLVLLGCLCAANAQASDDDYARGWCDGFKTARQTSVQNRDHYRVFLGSLGVPIESYDDAIRRMNGKEPPGYNEMPDIFTRTIHSMADAIDIFIVLPPSSGRTVVLRSGTTISCPK